MGANPNTKISKVDVLLDDDGPAVIVDAGRCPECMERLLDVRVGVTSADMQFFGRKAMTVAAVLEGTSYGGVDSAPAVDDPVPFRRIWPPRTAVEIGIPVELLVDKALPLGARLLYVFLWKRVHIGAGRPVIHESASVISRAYGACYASVMKWLRELEARGWISQKPIKGSKIWGSREIELFWERRPVDGDGSVKDPKWAARRLRGMDVKLEDVP